MLVTGATYPEELAKVRAVVGAMPLLVPGVGAQGGQRSRGTASRSRRSRRGPRDFEFASNYFCRFRGGFSEVAAAAVARSTMEEINKYS